jgi:hypothetical protein
VSRVGADAEAAGIACAAAGPASRGGELGPRAISPVRSDVGADDGPAFRAHHARTERQRRVKPAVAWCAELNRQPL